MRVRKTGKKPHVIQRFSGVSAVSSASSVQRLGVLRFGVPRLGVPCLRVQRLRVSRSIVSCKSSDGLVALRRRSSTRDSLGVSCA